MDSSSSSNETVDQLATHSDNASVDVSEQLDLGSSNETAEDQMAKSDDQVEESCEDDPIKKSDDTSVDESDAVDDDDEVARSDDQDDVSVHVSEQDCGEAVEVEKEGDLDCEKTDEEQKMKSDDVCVHARSDDQDDASVHVSEQDCGEKTEEEQKTKSDDDVSVHESVQECCGEAAEEDQVARSDDQDDASVQESAQDFGEAAEEEQVSESGEIEKTDEEYEQDGDSSNEAAEDEVAKSDFEKSDEDDQIQTKKSDDVSVNESEQDCGEDQVVKLEDESEKLEDDQTKKSDNVSETDCGSLNETQVEELDAVNEEVDEDPSSKWEKEYPPLPTRSQKVKSNVVPVVTSRKEVSKKESRTPTRVVEAVAEPSFSFLIKVPRLDESIQEQVNLAKLQLEDKTKLRDSIQCQIQEKRANSQIHGLDCEAANDEVKKLRNLVKSKQKQLHGESSADHGNEEKRHLKVLRKELQILKESIPSAAAAATEAEKKYNAEELIIKQLHPKCRAANEERQAAFAHFQTLKKKLSAKNQPFYRYKDDATAANNYANSGNKKALHCLCTNQVERVMELWNTNDEFRRDYVKSNARSTIRRLGTLDGRSLGPGEKTPVLPSVPHKKVDVAIDIRKTAIPDDTKLKAPTRSALKKLSEAELNKKAEEMVRKEEAEAKFKEQLRLEELAKAELAREKNLKREAEKEQREAEENEKERQRRLRNKEKKKEKKKGKKEADATTDVKNKIIASAETSKDVAEVAVPKKTQKVQLLTKTVPLPPSLQNRSKKGYRQLMWTGLISIFVYILFRLGDADVYSKLSVIR